MKVSTVILQANDAMPGSNLGDEPRRMFRAIMGIHGATANMPWMLMQTIVSPRTSASNSLCASVLDVETSS